MRIGDFWEANSCPEPENPPPDNHQLSIQFPFLTCIKYLLVVTLVES